MTLPTIQQALELAVKHHQANRLAEAEAIYRQVLAAQPRHPIALHLLARLVGQRGQLADAVDLLKASIAVYPDAVEAHIALGEFLRLLGRTDESIQALERAAQFQPPSADAFNSLGNSLRQAGRVEEAAGAFRRSIELKPTYAEPYSNLGNALRAMGHFEDSIAAHRQAVQLKPQSPEILSNLGIALKESGDIAGSVAAFSRAIELKPDYVDALNNLGGALAVQGRLDEALSAFTRAAALRPDSPEVQNNLGNLLKENGRLDESAAAYQRALRLRPDFAEAHSNLGINLSSQGKLTEAIESFAKAMRARPDVPQYFGNLLYTMHFHPDYDGATILREHLKWAGQYAEPLSREVRSRQAEVSARPNGRLRIGYVSPDFRDHPVGRFLAPLLAHHDPERVEVFCYSAVRIPDALTARMQGHADHWQNIVGRTDAEAAEQIRRDNIDVLVDLTLHMTGSRLLLFARKPAAVQATWLGYVGTSGLAAIDFRISDPFLDPPGTEEPYVERTVRLPRCYWCYEPAAIAAPVNALPALSAGHVTFGCFNNFMKVTPQTLDLWAKILATVPGSRIVIHSHAGSHREQAKGRFGKLGIDASRVEFVAMAPTAQYLRQHHQIDIALDPFPYGGGTTTCDALWMGVPVVSLAGHTAVGRAGVSLLNNVGLTQLVAQTPQQYVSIAAALAADPAKLAEIRAGLRERMRCSPLMDAQRFAADIEAAYRFMSG
ncbi:MAG TPA: tetratricopeptide repeat protein [Tepidisphaeraceae bacterium]|nr:tetratricopeptide repeat protein [Tepidisphaeraceae bacterium]